MKSLKSIGATWFGVKAKSVGQLMVFVSCLSPVSAWGQYQQTLDSLLHALEIQKSQHHYEALAVTCNEIGSTLENNGKTDEALRYYLTGKRIADKVADEMLAAQLDLSLSRIYYFRGEYEKTIELDSSARQVFHAAGNIGLEATATLYLGFAYNQLQDFEKALAYEREALLVFERLNDAKRISETLNAMGTAYQELLDFDRALLFYERSLAIDDSLGNTEYVAISHSNIAGIYIELENYPKAIENFEQAYALLDSTKSFYYRAAITRYLAESYALAGDYENAYNTMLIHQSYADSLNSEIRQEQFLRLQEEFEAEKRITEIQTLNKDKQQLADKLHSGIVIVTLLAGMLVLVLLLIFFYTRQRRAREHQKRVELEQKALRIQMNPHFIFNSLNSLQSMFMKGNFDLANDYLGDFGALLRHILDNSGKPFIPLEDELNTLKLYLSIERMRTDGRIDYEIHVDPEIDTRRCFVPPLIIQPFVENAIWHGILPSERNGNISIQIQYLDENTLRCEICDNGIGIAASQLRKKKAGHQSRGMEITSQRLGKNDQLKIEELPTGGTRVTLFIPLSHDQSTHY